MKIADAIDKLQSTNRIFREDGNKLGEQRETLQESWREIVEDWPSVTMVRDEGVEGTHRFLSWLVEWPCLITWRRVR